MSFKKRKISIKSEKNSWAFFSYFFATLWVIVVFFAWVSTLAYVTDIDFWGLHKIEKFYNIEALKLWNSNDPEKIKAKEDKNKINILVVGRGWGSHEAPDLTDTIILMSLNKEEETVAMLSIPRDLYVKYSGNKKWKINRLYEDSISRQWSVVLAMDSLSEKVEEISWEEIDYFVNLDFKGFIDLIDTVWGVEIEVPETFIDYEYPDNNLWYTTFILRKWEWTLDGETALKYARSRHSTSDFDRSLRQQQIINALKEKMVSLDYLTSPTKIAALYETFQKDIQTDIPLTKIVQIALIIKDVKRSDIVSANINDSCFFERAKCEQGWFLYYPRKDLFWGMSVLLPDGATNIQLSKYDVLQSYTDIIFNKTAILIDKTNINILNATKTSWLAWELAYDLTRYGFNISSIWWTDISEDTDPTTSVILYNNIDDDDPTLLELQKQTWLPVEKIEFPREAEDIDVRIEIILADDYLKTDGWIQ